MKQKAGKNVWTAIMFILAALMYYNNNESFSFGVTFMYKHLFAAIITVLSFCVFLVSTNLERASKLVRYAVVLMLPYFLNIAVSVPLWVTNLYTWTDIRGGLFTQLYHLNTILAMMGMVYVIGGRSIWVNLAAMLAANAVTFFETVMASGIGPYLRELWTAIITFADDTGEIISKMEVHELTFALGVYLVFFIINWRESIKRPAQYVAAALTAFFFLSGFKRIGVLAVVMAVFVGLMLWLGSGGKRKHIGWLVLAGFAGVAFLIVYVALIDWGFMTYLEERWGINLMGRANLLKLVEDFYHFGPGFFGHGTGFLYGFITNAKNTGLHNDILTLYVDIGFWGVILWGILLFPFRAWYFAGKQGVHGAILSLCYAYYLVFTAMTDNTFFYIYLTAAISVLIMGYRIDEPEGGETARRGRLREA